MEARILVQIRTLRQALVSAQTVALTPRRARLLGPAAIVDVIDRAAGHVSLPTMGAI